MEMKRRALGLWAENAELLRPHLDVYVIASHTLVGRYLCESTCAVRLYFGNHETYRQIIIIIIIKHLQADRGVNFFKLYFTFLFCYTVEGVE